MKPEVKMALSLIGYTCPQLDKLSSELLSTLKLTKTQEKIFLEFVETIKKDITCPLRTALEQACLNYIQK